MNWFETLIAFLSGGLDDDDKFRRLMRLLRLAVAFVLAALVIVATVVIIRANVLTQIVDGWATAHP